MPPDGNDRPPEFAASDEFAQLLAAPQAAGPGNMGAGSAGAAKSYAVSLKGSYPRGCSPGTPSWIAKEALVETGAPGVVT
jgi:hypothetical protein